MQNIQESKEGAVARAYTFNISLDNILKASKAIRKTKIICTLGPSISTVDKLEEMLRAGMNVARFNFSHGNHESHKKMLDTLREAMDRTKINCAVMLDTKGPEIRTGFYKEGGKIQLKAGQALEITTDYEFKGDSNKIACTYSDLPTSVKKGDMILIADGSVTVKVTEILEDGVKVEVLNSAEIGERKNMNLPGIKVKLPTLTQQDIKDIKDWGIPNGIDAIAASFIRNVDDIKFIRKVLGIRAQHIKIIAKIENQEGLQNYPAILDATDGIMVARGDLGMEIPSQKVFLAQKWMIRLANQKCKPIVTATQMLESMIEKPRPTRAECTDVANAVLDGSDSVMLSGETAGGKYPIEAVQIMSEICKEAEGCINYLNVFDDVLTEQMRHGIFSTGESVTSAAVSTARKINASVIIVLTEHGNSARLISKYRPEQIIFACSVDKKVINQLNFSRGVIGFKIASFIEDGPVELAVMEARKRGFCKPGDRVIAIHGRSEKDPTNSDQLRVLEV